MICLAIAFWQPMASIVTTAPFKSRQLNISGISGDFVRLAVHCGLRQNQPRLGGISTQYLHGFAVHATAPQGFAIQANLFTGKTGQSGLRPVQKGFGKDARQQAADTLSCGCILNCTHDWLFSTFYSRSIHLKRCPNASCHTPCCITA